MSRPRKCRLCSESILTGQTPVPFGTGYAHESCYEQYSKGMLDAKIGKLQDDAKSSKKSTKSHKTKPKAELKESLSEEEYADKQRYYNYLSTLVEQLSPKIYKLSEGYIKQYGVSWKDLYYTLVYMNEILDKELEGDVVGILPYFIYESQNFYKEVEQVRLSAKTANLTCSPHVKKVYVRPKKRRIKQIDMGSV